MNPNAVVYLREIKGQGLASVEYSLWKGKDAAAPKSFEITKQLTAEEVVAKVLMAARDPDLDDSKTMAASASAGASAGASAPATATAGGASPPPAAAAAAAAAAGVTAAKARTASASAGPG